MTYKIPAEQSARGANIGVAPPQISSLTYRINAAGECSHVYKNTGSFIQKAGGYNSYDW